MAAAASPSRNTPAGVVGMFGLVAGLCAVIALFGTVADWREEAAQARWPVVSARVESGIVDPHRISHGGTAWQLRYHVRFEADGQERVAILTSRSEVSDDKPAVLRDWAAKHRRGSRIDIRYDPAQPGRAVFASADVPDAGPRTTADLELLLIAASACVGLVAFARHLRAKEPDAAPIDPGSLSPRGRFAVGLAVAALGFLIIGLGLRAALRATHPLGSEDFIGALAAMVFVFGGALLALPPERAALQKLLGALLVTAFALTLDWVAFGPGPRRFGGGISIGIIGIGSNPGETLGRTVFGIGAVILDILAAVMWVRLIRKAAR
jgi:hypothetical protein